MTKVSFTDCVELVGETPKKFIGKKIYISTGAVNCNEINRSQTVSVSFENKPSRANLVAEEGDILFAKMQNTHKVLLLNEDIKEYIYSTGFCAVRAKKQYLTKKCLFYILNSPYFLRQKDKFCSGATQKAITNEAMSKIIINLPELKEQQEIVKRLDKISVLIDKRNQQLEKLDLLIKAKFIDMFETIFYNEKKYPIKKLKDVCIKITDGKHGGCKLQNESGFYFVGAREVYDDEIHYCSAPQISEEEFLKDYKRCDLANGDLVIVNTGATIGKSAIARNSLTSRTLLQKSVAMIRTRKDELLPVFLKYCYMTNPEMYRVESASAQPNLLLSRMKDTRIYLPPIKLQNEFARYVEQTEKSKTTIKQSLGKLETLKKALMQKYLG